MTDADKQDKLRDVRLARTFVDELLRELEIARKQLAERAYAAYKAGVSTQQIAAAGQWRTRKSVYDSINPMRDAEATTGGEPND